MWVSGEVLECGHTSHEVALPVPRSELFNAAFVSCWMELVTTQREDLVANLKLALSVPNIPEITQTLLNLAEFMEHCEEASVSGLLLSGLL